MSLRDKIDSCVSHLDEYFAHGWRNYVSVAVLDMSNSDFCVAGQIHSHANPSTFEGAGFIGHLEFVGIETDEAEDLGLDISVNAPYAKYAKLTRKWIEALEDYDNTTLSDAEVTPLRDAGEPYQLQDTSLETTLQTGEITI